ncbi:hypothetical protein F5Y14DRAFT_418174 [Nemania sp. NC0429]|nr:hypothetical protein F5Y14DRAFT_418174 [Nemania sp. NC0429]
MSDGESDDGRRAVKKRKASRACDRCNSQHQPCDNAIPKCSVCLRAGTDCTYNRPVRKRGPRSGYTGQNGERLWAIVLQARPDIEDVVLQALRGGTYGSTGISNLEYYRNNDNQTELVNKFNESRIARFLQNGASVDLNLPPLGQTIPLLPHLEHPRNGGGFRHENGAQGPVTLGQHHDRSTSLSSAVNSALANPHGAPQNPSDIYLQSEDIRRSVFDPSHEQRRSHSRPSYQGSPAVQSTGLGSNNSVNDYPEYKAHVSDLGTPTNLNDFSSLQRASRIQLRGDDRDGVTREPPDIEAAYHSHWLSSVPKDTLLNLGFVLGEGMEEDFLELCDNPDPIDSTPTHSTPDQDEDEEAIWRRLVMRGRFV